MTSTITEQPTATRRWTLDPARSSAEFHVRHFWGLITVNGHFDRLAGSYDGNMLELTIDADSLDTGNKQRDTHLRSGEFFDVDQHPQTTFRSTTITNTDDGTLHVEGELEAAGNVLPLSFDATIREEGDELELEATTTVDHRLFGMTWSPLGTVRTPAKLHVKARLT
jgi:polyisoprenoid-binding protein YceI